jgi:hypothetical protein
MIIEALINKEACVNGTSEMNRAQKNQFLRNQTSFKTPLDFAKESNSQALIDEVISKGAKEKQTLIRERYEASRGFIPRNQYQGERPSPYFTPFNGIRLVNFFRSLFPQ